MDARFRKSRIIVTVKRTEMFRIALGRTVRTEQTVLEIDGHFWHDGIPFLVLRRGYLDGGQQVLFRVAAEHAYRQLRTREHHWLAQILQHERQRGRRI